MDLLSAVCTPLVFYRGVIYGRTQRKPGIQWHLCGTCVALVWIPARPFGPSGMTSKEGSAPSGMTTSALLAVRDDVKGRERAVRDDNK